MQLIQPGAEARAHFPFFSAYPDAAYLDSGATAQKPKPVIDAITQFYERENANVHRGAYQLAANATLLLEESREKVAAFLGTTATSIVFTGGCTDSINIVARAVEHTIKPGDTILLSYLEHHSNIVPWQLLAKRRGAKLAYVDISPDGRLKIDDLQRKLQTLRPQMFACTMMSNVLGVAVDYQEVTKLAHSHGALVLFDAAQSVVHERIAFDRSQADFLCFSAHKLYGPSGVGVLAVRPSAYEKMEPVRGGGGMIEDVQEQMSTWAQVPQRFEGGTPPLAEIRGLGAAIDFLDRMDQAAVLQHEQSLFLRAAETLRKIGGVSILGSPAPADGPILSFNVAGIHPHDFATIADECGVQVRAGHHCAKLLLRKLGVESCIRASFGMYSVAGDIEKLVASIHRAQKIFTP